jgi:hypothetical protein
MSGLMDAVQFLADLIDGQVSLLPPPIPIEMNPAPGSPADDAAQAMAADAADGHRFSDLRHQYQAEYQLNIHGGLQDEPLSRQPLWSPWLYLRPCHLSAAIEVGAILDQRPQDVLAVWLVEGQAVFSRQVDVDWTASRATTRTEVLQAMRSWVFWNTFGTDRLSATYAGDNDRLWCPPDRTDDRQPHRTHEQKYQAVQEEITAVPGMSGPFVDHPDALERYLTSIGGVFQGLTVTGTQYSQVYPDVLPAGVQVQASGTLAPDCIGTLLYVEAALFAKYQNDTETLLKAEYDKDKDAAQIDLSKKPWVTYLGWNAHLKDWTDRHGQTHPGQYTLFLKGAADYPAAIAQFFGGDTVAGPPPDKLLKDAHPDLLAKWEHLGAVPFCTAVTVKYLSEACGAWFS